MARWPNRNERFFNPRLENQHALAAGIELVKQASTAPVR